MRLALTLRSAPRTPNRAPALREAPRRGTARSLGAGEGRGRHAPWRARTHTREARVCARTSRRASRPGRGAAWPSDSLIRPARTAAAVCSLIRLGLAARTRPARPCPPCWLLPLNRSPWRASRGNRCFPSGVRPTPLTPGPSAPLGYPARPSGLRKP
jgi:hypothetical protein